MIDEDEIKAELEDLAQMALNDDGWTDDIAQRLYHLAEKRCLFLNEKKEFFDLNAAWAFFSGDLDEESSDTGWVWPTNTTVDEDEEDEGLAYNRENIRYYVANEMWTDIVVSVEKLFNVTIANHATKEEIYRSIHALNEREAMEYQLSMATQKASSVSEKRM